jgi:hypothetical protein
VDLVCRADPGALQPVPVLNPPARGNASTAGAPSHSEAEHRFFDRRTERSAAKCAAAWTEANAASFGFGATVDLAAKLEREQRAERYVKEIESRLRRWPTSPARRATWRQELLEAMRRVAGDYLEGDTEGLDRLFTPEGLEATRQFVRQARAFAPDITDQNLFQALRNLWVTHSVQLFLHTPITLSPAIFAYSMLYPWTDNCLDDLRLERAAKVAFGDWLTLRLSGAKAAPRDVHSEQVGRLVGMIEQSFPRAEFPEVYLSLRAIHQAQMRSLDQQDAARTWDEEPLLNLSIAKGGTSVLTDACLVRGSLTDGEAEFMFAYGVLLQLMDDLQDLHDDLANRHMTIFTRQTGLGSLDKVTTRLWAFTQRVLWSFSRFASAQPGSLKSLIQDNLRLLLVQSVARSHEFYTPDFVRRVEASSPVRFSYLAAQEKTLAGRYSRVLASIRHSRRIDSLFEMLDRSSLQHRPM